MNKKDKNQIRNAIIGSVVSAIIIIVIQQAYSTTQNKPDLVITDIKNNFLQWVGREASFIITLHNQGKTTAQECYVYLSSDITSDSKEVASNVFSVTTERDEEIIVTDGVYQKEGNYTIQVHVACSNHAPTKPVIRTVVVEST